MPMQARIQDFLQGGGGQRRPCTAGAFGARADEGSRVDKHQIKVHSVHRIFRAIFFFFFFAIVKKFVEKKIGGQEQGGSRPPPPPPDPPLRCYVTSYSRGGGPG